MTLRELVDFLHTVAAGCNRQLAIKPKKVNEAYVVSLIDELLTCRLTAKGRQTLLQIRWEMKVRQYGRIRAVIYTIFGAVKNNKRKLIIFIIGVLYALTRRQPSKLEPAAPPQPPPSAPNATPAPDSYDLLKSFFNKVDRNNENDQNYAIDLRQGVTDKYKDYASVLHRETKDKKTLWFWQGSWKEDFDIQRKMASMKNQNIRIPKVVLDGIFSAAQKDSNIYRDHEILGDPQNMLALQYILKWAQWNDPTRGIKDGAFRIDFNSIFRGGSTALSQNDSKYLRYIINQMRTVVFFMFRPASYTTKLTQTARNLARRLKLRGTSSLHDVELVLRLQYYRDMRDLKSAASLPQP